MCWRCPLYYEFERDHILGNFLFKMGEIVYMYYNYWSPSDFQGHICNTFLLGLSLCKKHQIMHHHCTNDTKSDQKIVLHELAMIGKWFPNGCTSTNWCVHLRQWRCGDALFWHDNMVMSCGAWSLWLRARALPKERHIRCEPRAIPISVILLSTTLHSIKINATFREQGL
jgi:hypothetical protein